MLNLSDNMFAPRSAPHTAFLMFIGTSAHIHLPIIAKTARQHTCRAKENGKVCDDTSKTSRIEQNKVIEDTKGKIGVLIVAPRLWGTEEGEHRCRKALIVEVLSRNHC
jgi:hypothetical protein